MTKHIASVAVYEIVQNFGGNEEGGWWYDAGERVSDAVRFFATDDEAYTYANRLNTRIQRERERACAPRRYRNRTSAAGGTDIEAVVFCDESPPKHFPARRPQYE